MKKLVSLLAFASILLLSCQDDEITGPQSKILDYYNDSYEVPGLGFQPQMKVQYEYDNSGKLKRYTVSSFNPNSQALEQLRYFNFSYTTGLVSEVKGYLPTATTPYIEYSYYYLTDNSISKISENNHAAGTTSEANFIYTPAENKIKVVYSYSNGNGFEYEFNYHGQNIVTDKTTRGSQLCSDGTYTYDNKINPFSKLGYVDYTLTTLSVNNKLSEDVNYLACAFPSLIPDSYTYEYDEDGYPTIAITNYTTSGNKMKRQFFYLPN